MSSIFVRDNFRSQLQNFLATAFPTISFIDSINENGERPTVDEFCTVRFYAFNNDSACYTAGKNIEKGTCEIIVFSKPGKGDTRSISVAGEVLKHFITLNLGQLAVTNVTPPNDYIVGKSIGNYYGAILSIDYNYFY